MEEDLDELIRSSAVDGATVERLERALFSGGLHPRAAEAVPQLIDLAADDRTDDPGALLLTALQIAEALPAPAAVLRTRIDLLLAIVSTDPEPAGFAAELLGWCAPDAELSDRLRDIVDTTLTSPHVRADAMKAVARLDPQGSAAWLRDRLSAAADVAALDAMRIVGLPLPPVGASALTQAFSAPEHARGIYHLEQLLAYVGDPAVYAAAARSPYAVHRADAARALGTLHRAGELSGDLTDLLIRLLDDDAEEVQRAAYKVIVFDEALSRRTADRLAADLGARRRSRPGAMHALIGIGDPRWRPYAAEALREGWAPPSLLDALIATDPPWPEIRDAILARIGTVASRDYRGPITRRMEELATLIRLVLAADDADAHAELHRHLEHADDGVTLLIASALRRDRIAAPDHGERADHGPRSVQQP